MPRRIGKLNGMDVLLNDLNQDDVHMNPPDCFGYFAESDGEVRVPQYWAKKSPADCVARVAQIVEERTGQVLDDGARAWFLSVLTSPQPSSTP